LNYNPRVRNVFIALLLANIGYFAWAHWIDRPKAAPVNAALGKLPTLKMIDEVPPEQRGRPKTTQLTPAPAAACLSIGPFPDVSNSAQAAALLRAKGFEPKQRAESGQNSDGYGVFVSLKTQADTDRALETLEHAGIKDALVMPPENADAGRRLSLGLYSERARADRRAQAVRQSGLDAQVLQRKLPTAIYWVDVSPQSGMTTVPLQDLFAEGVSSHIGVQTCPQAVAVASSAAAAPPPVATPGQTATAPGTTAQAGTAKTP
jgi:hypothetical protein